MTRLLLLLLLWLAAWGAGARQLPDGVVILSGRIVDAFTREPVDSVWMEFLRPDSVTRVDTLMYRSRRTERTTIWGESETDKFMHVLPSAGDYLVRLSKRGWRTQWIPLRIPRRKYNRRVRQWPMGDLLLSRSYYMEERLNEVTVEATRVKMFHKGDTLVFNADAFQLAEGSMLDELIRLLPGVELRKGGHIYVNGHKVEELLVNGKDFFRGDAKVALENLPAYIVQHVKAYQKEPDEAYLDKRHAQRRKMDPWVLDVELKRAYNTGWIAHSEAGYGTDHRYLARHFGIRYTNRSRISAYANTNNVSQEGELGDEDWYEQPAYSGQTRVLKGGLDVNIDGKRGASFSSSFTGSRNVTDDHTQTSSATFLSTGDVYGRARYRGHDTSGSLYWKNHLALRKSKYSAQAEFSLAYDRCRSESQTLTATLAADPMDRYRGATLDTLFAPLASPRLDTLIINRTRTENRYTGHNLRLKGSLQQTFTSPLNGEAVSVTLEGNLTDYRNTTYSHYLLHQRDTTDLRNRYDLSPQHLTSLRASLTHGLGEVKGFAFKAGYTYEYQHNRNSRNLHRLDLLPGWLPGQRPLGLLPSTTDSLALALDHENSLHSLLRTHKHLPLVQVTKGGTWGYFFLHAPLLLQQATLHDTRNGQERTLSRRFALWNPSTGLRWKDYEFAYRYMENAPALTQLLDVTGNSNPLHISLGNPHLGKTRQHNYALNYYRTGTERQRTCNASLNAQHGTAIGNAMTYNRQTGVYTYQPRNVRGNWNASLRFALDLPLDSVRRWTLRSTTDLAYLRSVDWAQTHEESVESGLSRVHNYTAGNQLVLAYQRRTYHLSATLSADYTHQQGNQAGFTPTHTLDLQYGLKGYLLLPWDLRIDADFLAYSLRGYADHTMNDDRLVVHASLSKRLLRNRPLTLKLTARDLFGQISNVHRAVNAQGHTERWYNSQPSYVMLTVSYRLNKQPKNRSAE